MEVLGHTGPSSGNTPPSPLARGGRRLVAALAALVLLGGGVLFVRSWSADHELRQAVDLTATLGVASSSTSPPGGAVRYYLLVRNDGALPVSVTSVDAAAPGLRLRMRDEGERRIAPGREVEVPLSVRLTCVPGAGAARPALAAALGVRREDGGSTSRPVEVRPAALVLDVAETLCAVRPGLRDHELSGPVLRDAADR